MRDKIFKIIHLTFLTIFINLVMQNVHADNPHQMALIDTGFDLCVLKKNNSCKSNKNLLFRGDLPAFNRMKAGTIDDFRNEILSTISQFAHTHNTQVILPKTMQELKQYRIVIISLLSKTSEFEYDRMKNELALSNTDPKNLLPQEYKIVGLSNRFNMNSYALFWWPMSLDYDSFIDTYIKHHSSYPPLYASLNLLLNGNHETKSIHELLLTKPNDKHPLLIFYHCLAGRDRTGLVTMAYFMQNGGYSPIPHKLNRESPMTYLQAFNATSAISDDAPGKTSRVVAVGFCRYLGKPVNQCESPLKDKLSFLWHSIWLDFSALLSH